MSIFRSDSSTKIGNGKRFEEKYWITYKEYYQLRQAFQTLLSFDKHANEFGEYFVRSLYLDTPQKHCIAEKKIGLENRKKYRIRCYGKENIEFLNFEIKYRDKSQIWKKFHRLSPEEYHYFLRHHQFETKTGLPFEFRSAIQNLSLRPEVIVQYVREAYVFPVANVRLTFDKYLSHSGSCFDLLTDTPEIYVHPSQKMIFEVKYNHILPKVIHSMVHTILPHKSSISKYELCWEHSQLSR